MADLDTLRMLAGKDYRVTRDGRVFAVGTNWRGYGVREMSQTPNAHGYASVRLIIGGKRKRIPVHKLVAAFYLPPKPSPLHELRHLDGSRTNSEESNLVWGTKSENAIDRSRHGTERAPDNGRKSRLKVSGEKAGNAKLTDAQAVVIRERRRRGEGVGSIAADFSFVSYDTIQQVASGVTFSHLGAVDEH